MTGTRGETLQHHHFDRWNECGVNVMFRVGLMDIERYSVGLLIRRLRRGQGPRKVSDRKGRIFMKSSPHSFDKLVRIHHHPPRAQHFFNFNFARIDVLRRHDQPDPEIVQNDDEMRQQPSHDPPDNREQGQDAADQEGGHGEGDATERRGRRRSIRQPEQRKEDEEGDERPTDNATSGV